MKTSRTYRTLIGAAVALLACSAHPVLADERDDRIEQAFKDAHIYRTELSRADLNVDAENGVVTLEGTVENQDQSRLAEETARNLPGVVRVENKVKVTNEPAEASDDWIALKVRGALLFHRNVSATDTNVQVQNGIVTLTGKAKSDAEKALAGEYAADVKGVQRVDNQIRVVPEGSEDTAAVAATDGRSNNRTLQSDTADADGTVRNSEIEQNRRTMGDRIDDASITAQVKASLAVRKSTGAMRTNVTTRDGIVTISGEAKSEAEKDLVSKIAENIDGVRSVRNEMTVANR